MLSPNPTDTIRKVNCTSLVHITILTFIHELDFRYVPQHYPYVRSNLQPHWIEGFVARKMPYQVICCIIQIVRSCNTYLPKSFILSISRNILLLFLVHLTGSSFLDWYPEVGPLLLRKKERSRFTIKSNWVIITYNQENAKKGITWLTNSTSKK